MEHNFRVYKTAELAIMRLSYLSQIISNNELLSYLQDIAKQERIFYNSIEWHRDNQRTKSINHSIMDTHAWGQMLSKNVSKTRRSSFISPLCFFRFFFTKRQYPSKGQSTLWQTRSFFHVIFWCLLSQYDATPQLAQVKGTDPGLTRCLQV